LPFTCDLQRYNAALSRRSGSSGDAKSFDDANTTFNDAVGVLHKMHSVLQHPYLESA
jgi:hypothetical protein